MFHEADKNPCAMGKNYDVRLSQSMSRQQMASELSKLGKLSGAPVQKQVLENGEKVVYLRNPNALDKLKQAFSRNDALQAQRAPARALIYEKFGLQHLSEQALRGIHHMFSRGKGNASEVAAAMMAAPQSRPSTDSFHA